VRILRLGLRNWMCFRGEHELDLQAKPYAVVARDEGDGERSNWIGKSALLEAVRFALTGEHRFRTEDEWVTEGEPEGVVQLETDGGLLVVRSRKRGKSTQLQATDLRSGAVGKGDEAQKLIYEAMGLQADELEVAGYVGQGQTAQLVTADPASRTRMVARWLQLEKLQRAEEQVVGEYSKLLVERDRLEAEMAATRDVIARELAGENVENLERRMHEATERAGQLAREHREASLDYEQQKALLGRQQARDELGRIEERGNALELELAVIDEAALRREFVEARKHSDDRLARLGQTMANLAQKQRLARGEFDGQCPVAGIACPAREGINGRVEANRKLLKVAESEQYVDSTASRAAADRMQRAQEALQAFDHKVAERKAMQNRAEQLRQQAGDGGGPCMAQAEFDRARYRHGDAVTAWAAATGLHAELSGRRSRVMDATVRLGVAMAEAGMLNDQLQTLREATAVLGRTGAQRRVAEGALGAIEQGANARLQGAGVDLQVRVSWETEGSGPAKACSACGCAFPASEKVKECPRCAAPRGKHLVQQLRFLRSRQSGGADDLAGIALQLSASAWLRRRRGAQWSVLVMDEPTAQMDAAHRKAFAKMVLSEREFEQAFVVSHHPAALDALPGRIAITAGALGSRVEVVS
jgi:DNA repair exonuclease SbcCD ATPase subunit